MNRTPHRFLRLLLVPALVMTTVATASCAPAASAATAATNAYNWLVSQTQSTGLVASFERGQVSYTYDQAVAAIAFLASGDTTRAKNLLNELNKLQNSSGSWYTAYYTRSGAVQESNQHVGPVAWVALAVKYYEQKTGDTTTYHAMATNALNWALQFQQSDGGVNGGIDSTGATLTWASTEHNEDMYAALNYFGGTTYTSAAAKVKSFLDNVVWDSANNRWYGGRGDTRNPMDVNAWGVAVLGPTGTHNYQLALNYVMANQRNTETGPNGGGTTVTIDGFGFMYNNDIWFEGTGQMVEAFQVVGDTTNANYFLNQITLDQSRNGGIQYSLLGTNNGYWTMSKANAVSSAGWLIFAAYNVNPFQ